MFSKRKRHVLKHRQVSQQRAILEEHAHPPAQREQLALWQGADVLAEHGDRAFGRRHHEYGMWGGENEEERVLAGFSLHAPIGTRHLAAIRREAQHGVAAIDKPHAEAS